jgi:uncharacterized membrane protein
MLRLHEVHPSVVHFPLAMVPLTLALDAIGWLTDRPAFCDTARALMPVAAGSAMVAGAAGLLAQESVRAEGKAHDLLVTHRNLNLGLTAAVTGLAAMRMRRSEPTAAYLLTGLLGVVGMMYTAYLGGKMVYARRVGVEPDGVRPGESPPIGLRNLGRVARTSARHVKDGVEHIAQDTRRGELAPALRESAA